MSEYASIPSYRSIIVGIDGTPRSLRTVETAARLARDAHATLTVTCAYPELPPIERAMINDLLDSDSYSVLPAAAVDELLKDAAAHVDDQGSEPAVQYAVRGGPAEALLSIANHVSADLIVVGSGDFASPFGRFLRAFPAEIARRAHSDVLIIKSANP
ncbi:universal stress protein [Nocardia brasiliensis]|uniref:universal stress protein n=1 Tax=Nocardia brasiliensis TaxID=37326 RepID=UPI002454B718|nr:universal stress protein [Nocardia brasiliensis]